MGSIKSKIIKKDKKNNHGQTIMEFVLLMSIISIVGFGLLRNVNSGISKYWKAFVTIIVDDPSQKIDF